MSDGRSQAAPLADLGLVHIAVKTTREHALKVLPNVLDELKKTLARLQGAQAADIAQEKFGEATYINGQISRALTAAFDAQQLLDTFTSQGEEQHGHEV